MNDEETVQVRPDQQTVDKLNKMTKAELVERICVAAIETRTAELRCQTAIEDARKIQIKLNKAEAYVEQGRAMIEAVMQRWYEYDV